MNLSVKKAGRVLLAMLTGASMSFGLTLAFSTPAQASQVECNPVECSQSCQAKGSRFGKCVNAACTCF
ncbi:Invertebrate defensins family profile domain-containing protein [Corallococcus soli]